MKIFDFVRFANNPAEWETFKSEMESIQDEQIKLKNYFAGLLLSKGKSIKFQDLSEKKIRTIGVLFYQAVNDFKRIEIYTFQTWLHGNIEIKSELTFATMKRVTTRNLFEQIIKVVEDLNYQIGHSKAVMKITDLLIKKLNGQNLDERFLTLEDLNYLSELILTKRDLIEVTGEAKKKILFQRDMKLVKQNENMYPIMFNWQDYCKREIYEANGREFKITDFFKYISNITDKHIKWTAIKQYYYDKYLLIIGVKK